MIKAKRNPRKIAKEEVRAFLAQMVNVKPDRYSLAPAYSPEEAAELVGWSQREAGSYFEDRDNG